MQNDTHAVRNIDVNAPEAATSSDKLETRPEWRKPAVTLIDINKKTMGAPISVA